MLKKELRIIARKIDMALEKFEINLADKIVLTEAASGNYVVTPIIAALAGAKVFAYSRSSRYATFEEVVEQTQLLAAYCNVLNSIRIEHCLNEIDFKEVDIVTNTGFLRPIDSKFIERLSPKCVIPLMWEPWEYRRADLDLAACKKKGIKVYGTNEDDSRLRTKEYIGFIVLYKLLEHRISPFSGKILILGSQHFAKPVANALNLNGYDFHVFYDYSDFRNVDYKQFSAIVLLEHENPIVLIGPEGLIRLSDLDGDTFVLHICGNVEFGDADLCYQPQNPARFGYMSFTTDYIDSKAVIDLHVAGLKVAEGMIQANEKGLEAKEYKVFMEKNFPALSFDQEEYW